MNIEVLTRSMNDKKRNGRWIIVAIDADKDTPVDLATVVYSRSAAVKERNTRCEYWCEQAGVESVVSQPIQEGSRGDDGHILDTETGDIINAAGTKIQKTA